jgi:hypothetical protein
MGRLGLFALIAGGFLCFFGYKESTLGSGMTKDPEEMTLAQLIQRGPEGNPHVKIRDFSLGSNFVYEEKSGKWNMVYIPASPRPAQVPPGVPVDPTGPVQAIIMTGKVNNETELVTLALEPGLTGLVVNRIKSLNKEQKKLLSEKYPTTDFDKCIIFNHGRTVIAPWVSMGMMVGGALLGALGILLMLLAYKRHGSVF